MIPQGLLCYIFETIVVLQPTSSRLVIWLNENESGAGKIDEIGLVVGGSKL